MTIEAIISHLTSLLRSPRAYFPILRKRFAYRVYFTFHPDYPWLTPYANAILLGTLKGNERVIEFGAGRSTIFLARRVKLLISIEHDPVWYHRVLSWLKELGLNNVTLKLIRDDKEYIDEIRRYPDEYFDLILIDGLHRLEIFINALPKVKDGGFIIFDNSDEEPYKSLLEYYINALELRKQFIIVKTVGPMHETTFFIKKKLKAKYLGKLVKVYESN